MQDAITETKLLRAGLLGNKEAFATIVERYQSLICAITYSATGDLVESRRLAKETFIRAWSSRTQISEPDKFCAWLCRIARNLAAKAARIKRFGVIRDTTPPDEAAPQPPADLLQVSPEDQMLVWQALEAIPEKYREPLVLYFRGRDSMADLAADLGLSEKTAQQRLSKARELLNPDTAPLVEEVLAGTRPQKRFTLAVLAALTKLPDSTLSAIEGATLSEAGSEQAQSTPEYSATEPGALAETQQPSAPQTMSTPAVCAAFAGCTFGGIAWILSTSLMAKDWPAAVVATAAAVGIFLAATSLCLRNQTKRWPILIGTMVVLCVLNLAVVNVRWTLWSETFSETPAYNPAADLSRWTINLIIAAIIAALLLLFLRLNSRQRQQTTEPPQQPSD